MHALRLKIPGKCKGNEQSVGLIKNLKTQPYYNLNITQVDVLVNDYSIKVHGVGGGVMVSFITRTSPQAKSALKTDVLMLNSDHR